MIRLSSFLLLSYCAMDLSVAQYEWFHSIPGNGRNVSINDAVITEQGHLLVIEHWGGAALGENEAYVQQIDHNGVFIDQIRIRPDQLNASFTVLLSDPNSPVFHVIGTAKNAFGISSLGHHIITHGPAPVDSSLIQIMGVNHLHVDNAILTSNNEVMAVAASRPSTFLNRSYVFHLDAQMNLLNSRTFDAVFHMIARDIAEVSTDRFLVACRGADDIDYESTYFQINGQLDLVDQFYGSAYDGSGWTIAYDQLILDLLHLTPLNSGNVIAGGVTGTTSGVRAAIHKVTLDGTVLAHFAPESSYPHDYVPLYANSDRTPDGDILFARTANFEVYDLWAPDEPNEIHVYKLDTALELLCSRKLDGFIDDFYYFINRIKATDDGGYLLMGMRADVTMSPLFFEGWIAKFPPMDCFADIESHTPSSAVHSFPNPGNDQCTIVINGPARKDLWFEFHDGRGALMMKGRANSHMTQVETRDWSPGLYFYRVIDGRGQNIGRGTWIKE